MIADIR
jgi:hypothetical protein